MQHTLHMLYYHSAFYFTHEICFLIIFLSLWYVIGLEQCHPHIFRHVILALLIVTLMTCILNFCIWNCFLAWIVIFSLNSVSSHSTSMSIYEEEGYLDRMCVAVCVHVCLVCMCVCMSLCVHACVSVCMCVSISLCVSVSTCACVGMSLCVSVYVCVCTHACAVCVCVHMCLCMCVCEHVHGCCQLLHCMWTFWCCPAVASCHLENSFLVLDADTFVDESRNLILALAPPLLSRKPLLFTCGILQFYENIMKWFFLKKKNHIFLSFLVALIPCFSLNMCSHSQV